MKALLFYNLKAGRGKALANIEKVADVFRASGFDTVPLPIDFAKNPFDGHEDAQMAVVAGGDGTINYVVNRMKERGLDMAIGIIPSGTANDFAGAVGMSRNPVEAARQIVTGREQRLDCGCVNGLSFVNIFSFGLFTTTSQRTSDERKRKLGKLAYILEGIGELRSLRPLPLHFVTDGGEFDVDALMVLIFNGETAGGFRLARTADVRDGLFDALVLERRNFAVTCVDMVRYLLGGSPRSVRHFRSQRISVSGVENILTDVDGQRGADFPLDISCTAGGLRVICPVSGR